MKKIPHIPPIPPITIIDQELEALYKSYYSKNITKIPEKFFSEEYLLKKDKSLKNDVYGTSIFHLATLTNQVNQIKDKYFKGKYLMTPDGRGRTVMASLANMQNEEGFRRIPEDLLTKENLTTRSHPPVICELAGSKHLDLVPEDLLTKENLLTRDSLGNSAFIICARVGNFKQIPKEILSENILLHEDNYTNTLADHLASRGHLHLLSPKWINESILLNNSKEPTLDSVVVYAEDNNDFEELKMVVKALSITNLENLIKLDKYPPNTEKILLKEQKRKLAIQRIEKGLNEKNKDLSL